MNPIQWFLIGLIIFVTAVGLLFLPGHNLHGGILTGLNFLSASVLPLICYFLGLIEGIQEIKKGKWFGSILNLAGLSFHIFWLCGDFLWPTN